MKLKLTIAYDGAAYAGWQVQKTGVAIQQKVEEVLARFFPSAPQVHSSSRTDAGVHALGLVADVEIPKRELKMTPYKLVLALNAFLPEDIRIMAAARAPAAFHARFDARGKQYRYYVWNHMAANPLLRHLSWHVPVPLDLAAMRAAAGTLLGKHDFKSFATTHPYPVESTVRTLSRCDIRRNGPLLTFIIEGDGFLYKMCRGIVGTLVQLGRGKFHLKDFHRMLAARDRRVAGMTAPAQGLVLWKVFYRARGRAVRPANEQPGAKHARRAG